MARLPGIPGKIIAIDGTAASGKSTSARLLARRLGYIYLDTGAMYRAVTLMALEQQIATSDGRRLTWLAKTLHFSFRVGKTGTRVLVNDRDVTRAIRSPAVTAKVSEVAKFPGVRRELVARQKECGRQGSLVIEGRDTTTVVFPDADLKIYLEASIKERARRRLKELTARKVGSTLAVQVKALRARDRYDSKRELSPLRKAPDAVRIDTSNMSVAEQVNTIIELCHQRGIIAVPRLRRGLISDRI